VTAVPSLLRYFPDSLCFQVLYPRRSCRQLLVPHSAGALFRLRHPAERRSAAPDPVAPVMIASGMTGHAPSPRRQAVELVVCTAGIYGCYLKYGLLQERIYAFPYANGEQFQYSAFLVAVQTAANALVALLVILASSLFGHAAATDPKPSSPTKAVWPPLGEYAIVALSYLAAMLFSFSALNHMSYPVQALGKSSKMIPVMLMGVVIRRRRYAFREYFCVFLVTAGVALFSFKPAKPGATDQTSPLGVALLLGSLLMDGITGPLQERLVARHSPSTHQLMFYQNLCACAWLVAYLLVSGEGVAAAAFVARHDSTAGLSAKMALFAGVSAIGQNFIFYTVRHFSALATTTITTTRKMFTVLLSIFVFGHAIAPRQWAGMALVFAAIAWEAVAKVRAKSTSRKSGVEEARVEAKKAQ
jgi:solute carrier family 35 (UDP-galactose transporter), member B1